MIFVGKFLKVATLTCKSKQKTFILDYEVKLTQVKNLLWCSEISKTFVATVTNNSEQKWAMSIRVELSQVIQQNLSYSISKQFLNLSQHKSSI